MEENIGEFKRVFFNGKHQTNAACSSTFFFKIMVCIVIRTKNMSKNCTWAVCSILSKAKYKEKRVILSFVNEIAGNCWPLCDLIDK